VAGAERVRVSGVSGRKGREAEADAEAEAELEDEEREDARRRASR
jgi:hypothetical protein